MYCKCVHIKPTIRRLIFNVNRSRMPAMLHMFQTTIPAKPTSPGREPPNDRAPYFFDPRNDQVLNFWAPIPSSPRRLSDHASTFDLSQGEQVDNRRLWPLWSQIVGSRLVRTVNPHESPRYAKLLWLGEGMTHQSLEFDCIYIQVWNEKVASPTAVDILSV